MAAILRSQERQIEELQAELDQEERMNQAIKGRVEKWRQARDGLDKKALKDTRAAKFYRDKFREAELAGSSDRLKNSNIQKLVEQRRQVEELERALASFSDLGLDQEPTNERLKQKIEELKKSRLSLDMSFDD